MDESLAKLRALIGLPDTLDGAITAAIRDLMAAEHTAGPDLTWFEPIGALKAVLNVSPQATVDRRGGTQPSP
ncbi:MAG: hypothetical protein HQL40_14835 [Alphaproteobacteria bacterium]|nr:hypothetical protein [Alphaproteobacteria bacterium]